ncbi:hypothetical protein SLS64_010094 [Diaporthe eres]|uniref:Uncharacterized protein n=1 Tax=Diaporthe eres TaxID=83184 RepID=A0ABR1P7F8_DIAER
MSFENQGVESESFNYTNGQLNYDESLASVQRAFSGGLDANRNTVPLSNPTPDFHDSQPAAMPMSNFESHDWANTEYQPPGPNTISNGLTGVDDSSAGVYWFWNTVWNENPLRKGQAILCDIDGHYAGGAECPGNSAAEQPDWPGAKYGKAFALRVSGKTTAMHCDTQWLDEGPFGERNLARKQMAAFLWENVVGRKGPVVWWCGSESYIRAKIVTATPALLANVACSAGLESYSVAGSQVLDIRSTFFDDSCRFVAEDDGFVDDVSAYPTMLPVMDLADEMVSIRRH